MMADENEIYQKKNGFILYKNYIKSVNKMTNEQAGELFKIILHYANTGELLESDDPRVDTALDFIGERLEFDIQKYLDTCDKRRENGSKGGRGNKREVDETEDAEEAEADTNLEKANGLEEKQNKAKASKKPDTDTETDNDTVTDMETDTDTETCDINSRRLRLAGADPCEENSDELMRFGENQYLTTKGVVAQTKALAKELLRHYWKTTPSDNDVENVFLKCYTLDYLPDGEHYAAFSPQKADMLRHVFKQAAEQGGSSWSYIEGIYNNYRNRGVETLEEAVENEYRWARGEI